MDWTIVQFERDSLSRKSSPRRPRAPTSSTTFPSRRHFSTLVSALLSPVPFKPFQKFLQRVFLSSFFPFFPAPPKISNIVNRSSTDNTLFFWELICLPKCPLIPVTRVLHRVCAQFWWDKRRVNTRRRLRQRQRSARIAETRLHSPPSAPLQAEKPWIDTTRSHTCAPLTLSLSMSLSLSLFLFISL